MKKEELLLKFGKRIKQLREAENLTQEKLAEHTGFHRTYIGMVERGERNISLKNINVFAEYFRMSLAELLGTENFGEKE